MNVFKDYESAIASGDLAKRGGAWLKSSDTGSPSAEPATVLMGWPTERATSRVISDDYQRPLRDQSGGPQRLVLRYDPGPAVPVGQGTNTRISLVGDNVTLDGTAVVNNMQLKYYLLQGDSNLGMDFGDLGIFVESVNSTNLANGDPDLKLELWVDEGHMAAFDIDPKKVFFDQYLTRLQDLNPGFLRTGPDWSNNNRSSPEMSTLPGSWTPDWTQRPLPTSPRWSVDEGVPWEVHAWLANELNVDLWVCIPFMQFDVTAADTDPQRAIAKTYVEGMADVLKAELDPSHHLYLEYSNEVWNQSFTTFAWLQAQASTTQAQQQLIADMTAIVYNWFLERWYAPSTGTRDCQVKLMAMGQLANSSWANTLAATLSCDNLMDALGAALYATPDTTLRNKWLTDDANVYNGDIPDAIMYQDPAGPDLQEIVNGPMTVFVNNHATLASSFAVDLYMYEGGPSLIPIDVENELGDDYSQFQDSSYAGTLTDDIMDRFLDRIGNPNQVVPVTQFGFFAFCQNKDFASGDFLTLTDLYAGTPEANVNIQSQYKFDAVKDFNGNHQ